MTRRSTLVSLLTIAVFVTSCTDATSTKGVLPRRTADAGSVKVAITPTRFDNRGARFAITLDTHSGDLSTDLESATLSVDGTAWTGARWNGDGPSGHHRAGSLGFTAGGPARGTARLTISGFSKPVVATWRLPRA